MVCGVDHPHEHRDEVEFRVLDSKLVVARVLKQVFLRLFEVEQGIKHDWETCVCDIVDLIKPRLVQSLARESR